ncbi:hypothetical protein C8Q70DRAFT_658026 [Cubamyces menziesii]|nr:hypothetical protein C8Q70DRAFT_658026 [Cubamyces menziesii]
MSTAWVVENCIHKVVESMWTGASYDGIWRSGSAIGGWIFEWAPTSAPGSGGQITSAIYAVIFPDLRWTLCSAFHTQRGGGSVRIWYGAGRACMAAQRSRKSGRSELGRSRVGERAARSRSRSRSGSA